MCRINGKIAIRLTQFFRLLKSEDKKTSGTCGFWFGNLLEDFLLQFRVMVATRVIPSFFLTIYDLLNEAVEAEWVTQRIGEE